MTAFLFWSVGSSDTAFAGGTRFDLFVSVCDIIHGGSFCRVRDRILQSCDLANHFLSICLEKTLHTNVLSKENYSLTSSQKIVAQGLKFTGTSSAEGLFLDLGLRAAGKA